MEGTNSNPFSKARLIYYREKLHEMRGGKTSKEERERLKAYYKQMISLCEKEIKRQEQLKEAS